MKNLFILIVAISLVACVSPKAEEVVVETPAVDSCAAVVVDSCAVTCATVAVVTPTVK